MGHHIFRESHIHPLYFYTINPQSKNTWIRKVPYKFKIRGPNFQGQCSLHPEPFPAMSPPLQHPTLCPGPLGIASAWAGKGKRGTAGTLVKQWNHGFVLFFFNMINIIHINLNQEAILSSTRSCQNSWLLYTSCFGHTKRRKHHKPCLAGLGNWYHQNICTWPPRKSKCSPNGLSQTQQLHRYVPNPLWSSQHGHQLNRYHEAGI